MSTEKIARFAVETSYERLPAEAIAGAKRAILDCLGVALAAHDDPAVKLITEYVREEGGNPEAGVIGAGFKALASQAAWANGTMSHALDYDDYSASYLGHPTVAILPAVLALGEKYCCSGKDILLAYIIGFEAGAKVGPSCLQHYMIGWHCTATLGSLGATVAAAKILKLDIEETKMALGIGCSLAGGLKQNFGTMTKPLHAGNAARNGVVAANLVRRGFTADKTILETPQGFCRVLAGGADLDLSKVGEGLGERYNVVTSLSLKPFPSCAGTHTSIEAALRLRNEQSVKAEEVEEIELKVHPTVRTATIHTRPKAGLEGKFSNEYCVARALLDGEVGLKHFTDEQVNQPEAQKLIHKTTYGEPPEISNPLLAMTAEVVMKLRDGRVVTQRVDSPKGEASNPLSWEDVCTKYRDCASAVLPAQEVESCLEMVANLESIPDITQLMKILTFKGK